MKKDFMDKVQERMARHRGKGLWSYLVYILIFLFLAGYVIGKPLANLLTLNKLKQK